MDTPSERVPGDLARAEPWSALASGVRGDFGHAVEAFVDALHQTQERLGTQVDVRGRARVDADPHLSYLVVRDVMEGSGRKVTLNAIRLAGVNPTMAGESKPDDVGAVMSWIVCDLTALDLDDEHVHAYALGLVERTLGEVDAHGGPTAVCVDWALQLAGHMARWAEQKRRAQPDRILLPLALGDIVAGLRKLLVEPEHRQDGLHDGVAASAYLVYGYGTGRLLGSMVDEAVELGVVETCVRACLASWSSARALSAYRAI